MLATDSAKKVLAENLKQQTTETDQPKVELKTKTQDATEGEGENKEAKELAENLKNAIARGDIEIEVLGENVVVNFTPLDSEEKELLVPI